MTRVMKDYTLHCAEAPQSLNAGGAGSRRHWGIAHREKKRWEEIFGLLLLAEGVPKGMLCCSAEATISWRKRIRRDVTNYVSPLVKPLADVLVSGGWLPDDTDEFFMFGQLSFDYPDDWPLGDPRVKARLEVRLTAVYLAPVGSLLS